mgnify:FL=1|jgi:hypothetical protein
MAKGFSVKPNQPELYRIEEECTSGWQEYKTNLTKEQTEAEYQFLINEGYPPSRIKVIRIQ